MSILISNKVHCLSSDVIHIQRDSLPLVGIEEWPWIKPTFPSCSWNILAKSYVTLLGCDPKDARYSLIKQLQVTRIFFFRKLLSWTHMQLNLSLQWDQRKWHWLLSYQAFISHWHWMVWTFKGNLILPNGNWKIDYTKDCQLESRCAVRWRPHPSLFKLPLLLQLTFSLVPLNPTRQKILSHPIAC